MAFKVGTLLTSCTNPGHIRYRGLYATRSLAPERVRLVNSDPIRFWLLAI